MSVRDRICEIAPIAIAVVFGVCAIIFTGASNTDFSDSADYLIAARMLFETGSYPDVGTLPFFRPPLYPLFIAMVWTVFPGSILAVKAIQIALFGATAWLVFKITERITDSKNIALIAGLLFSVNPFFFYFAAAVQSEVLHTFLFVLSLFLMIDIVLDDKVRIVPALLLGAVLGLAALNKPSALAIGAGMALVLFVLKFRQKGSLTGASAVIAAMFVTILPWSLFNLKSRGEFILINDAGGYNLWVGNHPRVIEVYTRTFDSNAQASAFSDEVGREIINAQIAEWESTVGYSSLLLKERERLWMAKAIENAIVEPWLTIKILLWKFFHLWKPFVSSSFYSVRTMLVSGLFLVPLYLLGLWGLLSSWNNSATREVAWVFLSLAIMVTAIHVAIVGFMRLRLPYIDPFLTVFVAIGVAKLSKTLVPNFQWIVNRLGLVSHYFSELTLFRNRHIGSRTGLAFGES